jgi:hypothetical protein
MLMPPKNAESSNCSNLGDIETYQQQLVAIRNAALHRPDAHQQ